MRKSTALPGFVLCIAAILQFAAAPLAQAAEGHGDAEIEVSGSVAVGFGQVSLGEPATDPATSSLDGVGEAIVNFAAEKGAFSAQIELEVDEATTLEVAQHELVWAISDSLSLIMSGASLGIESAEGNIGVINGPAGQVGDEEVALDFSDTGMVNVEFTTGGIPLGLASVAGFGIHYVSAENTIGANKEELTNIDVVYVMEVGDATVGPEYRSTTVDDGTDSSSDTFILFGMLLEF